MIYGRFTGNLRAIQTAVETAVQTAVQTADQTADQAADRITDQTADQRADQAAGQAARSMRSDRCDAIDHAHRPSGRLRSMRVAAVVAEG